MIIWILLVAAAGLLAVTLLHMQLRYPKKKAVYEPRPDEARALLYARKLSRMLQCETVSSPEEANLEKFRRFHGVLEELFPMVHANLEKTELDGNLLFFWKGRSSARPLVLMSHMDTVPAEGDWKYPPFAGTIAEGRVWGRGAFDTKCSVMGFFQAVEELLEQGVTPAQDVYLSSSCTEETGGTGCPKLVAELARRGVTPYLVCDEGGSLMTDPVPGVRGRFAMVGVQEKGMASVDLIAEGEGGHTSTPARHTPVARLADFVHVMEHHDPFRRRLPQPVRHMMQALAPYGCLPVRYVFANLWLFGPLVAEVMPRLSPKASAMLQSTISFTMQSGSEVYNAFPSRAVTGASMRFIPHQGMEESLELVARMAQRFDLRMEVVHAEDATPQTELGGGAWRLFSEVIAQTFPGAGISPYLLTGGTDARFYQKISPHVVRFAPVVEGPEEKAGIHGLNESISCSCLPGCVDFYKNLIRAFERLPLQTQRETVQG